MLGFYFLLRMMRAAITPGTQPAAVSSSTMSIEPHPLSITAKGGKKMDKSTRQKLMVVWFLMGYYWWLSMGSRIQRMM